MLAVEGNRQVPFLLKGATVVSGAIAVKIGQTVTAYFPAIWIALFPTGMSSECSGN